MAAGEPAAVTLRYFAWVREKAGRAEERVVLPESVVTVSDLIQWQKTRGPELAEAFATESVIRTAIDQSHVKGSTPVAGAREIAFFPPVTGG